MVGPDAFLGLAVEVGIVGNAELGRAVIVALDGAMRRARGIGDRDRPALAMQLRGAVLVVLHAPEIGEHVAPAPARRAHVAPVVVVGGLAADVDEGVDRGGPAEHLAPRHRYRPAAQARLGLGGVHPVDRRVVEGLGVADRRLDPEAPIGRPGLDQRNLEPAIGGEPRGHRRAGRSPADDDVVEKHALPVRGGIVAFRAHSSPAGPPRKQQPCHSQGGPGLLPPSC